MGLEDLIPRIDEGRRDWWGLIFCRGGWGSVREDLLPLTLRNDIVL